MIASMYKSVEGTLANMKNMPKQYWSTIAPILGAIGELTSLINLTPLTLVRCRALLAISQKPAVNLHTTEMVVFPCRLFLLIF